MSFEVYLFILRERQRDREHEGGAEREVGRIPSRLHALSAKPDMGLKPANREAVTRADTASRTLNRLRHPGAL